MTTSTALASDYTIIDLGTLGGANSSAKGINDNGAVVGWSQTDPDSNRQHAFLWDPQTATMRDLGTLGGTSSEAVAINNSGQIAGWSDTASGEAHAFLWDPQTATMRDLGTLGGTSSEAVVINNAGQIAGWSNTASGEGHAFLWDPQTAAMRDLGTVGGNGNWSTAYDIDDDGSVLGASGYYGGLSTAFLWDSTTESMRDLGLFGYSTMYRIMRVNWWSGQVVGTLRAPGGDLFVNVAWDPLSETGRVILESDLLISEINDLGMAAAWGWSGGALNLNTGTFSIFTLGPAGSHSNAAGINHSGLVVGQSDTTYSCQLPGFCYWNSHAYLAIPPFVAAGGFSGPLEGPPYVNSVKAGAAVPVKWQLPDGNGGYVCDPAAVTSITAGEIPCDVYGASPENVVAVEPTGGSGLRCDGDTFVFTWKTSRTWAGKCFALLLNLSDGTTQDAWFAVK